MSRWRTILSWDIVPEPLDFMDWFQGDAGDAIVPVGTVFTNLLRVSTPDPSLEVTGRVTGFRNRGGLITEMLIDITYVAPTVDPKDWTDAVVGAQWVWDLTTHRWVL